MDAVQNPLAAQAQAHALVVAVTAFLEVDVLGLLSLFFSSAAVVTEMASLAEICVAIVAHADVAAMKTKDLDVPGLLSLFSCTAAADMEIETEIHFSADSNEKTYKWVSAIGTDLFYDSK